MPATRIVLPQQRGARRLKREANQSMNLILRATLVRPQRRCWRNIRKSRSRSGRRNSQQQAHAMAGNVAANRRWIEQTYAKTAQRAALQGWVDSDPQAKSAKAIEAGLTAVMARWTDAQKRTLSQHFSGEAFDIQPLPARGFARRVDQSLASLAPVPQKEGGLMVWPRVFNRRRIRPPAESLLAEGRETGLGDRGQLRSAARRELRDRHQHDGALAGPRGDAQRAAVQFDERIGDRQAEARAFHAVGHGRVAPARTGGRCARCPRPRCRGRRPRHRNRSGP